LPLEDKRANTLRVLSVGWFRRFRAKLGERPPEECKIAYPEKAIRTNCALRESSMASQSEMQYAHKIILHAPPWHSPKLESFVEKCIQDKVVLVCVIGDDCARVEDVIDELVVGDGANPTRFLHTTSHPHESISEVRKFAEAWTLDANPTSPVQEVTL
jgi:hypothetical protein